ncbi:MAG: hypothetical protein ACUVTF_07475 [bacterium]
MIGRDMNKCVCAIIIISALIWAQTKERIPPRPAGGINTRPCCGRPVKPPEAKPERIEPAAKAEQRLSEGWAFLIFNSKNHQAMQEIFNKLEKNGVNTNGLRWPPHCALIKATKDDEAKILSVEGIEAIYYGPINLEDIPYKDEFTTGAIEYWKKFIRGEFDENIPVPGLEPPKNDMHIPPQNYRYQSDYMFGSVATCIFFPESQGLGNENWTPALRDAVISEVQAGLQRWVNWASAETPPVNLSFSVYYYDYTLLPTDCEPITLNSYLDEGQWIHDCMDDIGVPYYASYFDRVSYFNNWLRDYYGTDWAHSIFVANSYNDVDGCFADGMFAYLGGPFLQMTNDKEVLLCSKTKS